MAHLLLLLLLLVLLLLLFPRLALGRRLLRPAGGGKGGRPRGVCVDDQKMWSASLMERKGPKRA